MNIEKGVKKELLPSMLILLTILILPFLLLDKEDDNITGRLARVTTVGGSSPLFLKSEASEPSCSQCSDGTSKNSCSSSASKYCDSTCNLVLDIAKCGCSGGYSPSSDSSVCCEDSSSCTSDQGCVGSVYYSCVENNDGCKEFDSVFSAECGSECNSNIDCQRLYGDNSVCNLDSFKCSRNPITHCSNGRKDGDESGIDCGGSCLNLCDDRGTTTISPGKSAGGTNQQGNQDSNNEKRSDSSTYVPVLRANNNNPKEFIIGNLPEKSRKDLGVEDKLVFVHKSEIHNIQILSIRGNSVMLRISSDKVILTIITPGKTQTYDIDGDDIADLRIKLLSVKNGKASVYVERIVEEEESFVLKSPPRNPRFVFDSGNRNIFILTLSSIIMGLLLTSLINKRLENEK